MPDNPSGNNTGGPRKAAAPPRRRGDLLRHDSEIGARLRDLYAEVEQEPIPGKLLDLLEQLSEAEKRSKP